MASRSNKAIAPAAAAPTELAIKATIPAQVMVTAPDVVEMLRRYNTEVNAWTGFQVVDDASYIKAGLGFKAVADYIDDVESKFEKTVDILHKAWKGMTGARGMFTAPSALIKDSLAQQQFAWRRRKDDERMAEERRLQQEAEEHAARAREKLRLEMEAENLRMYEVRRQAALEEQAAVDAERMPWDEEEGHAEAVPLPLPPAPVELPPVEVATVRLPSTVPTVAGLQPRKLPWTAKVTDFKAMVIWIGKQAEAGDDRWLEYLEPASVRLNQAAKEHTTSLAQIIPGVEGFQGETLARS